MLKAALLFIPLLAGYVFSCTWNFTRYKTAREDSQRLYFRAAYYGIFLAASAFLICLIIQANHETWLQIAGSAIHAITPWSALGAAPLAASERATVALGFAATFLLITLALGSLLGFCLNLLAPMGRAAIDRFPLAGSILKPFSPLLYPVEHAIRVSGDEIEGILMRAIKKTMPVLATMSNGKVYVGHVVELTEPRDQRKTLRLLPLLSGFRKQETGKVSFTTSYSSIFQRIIECQNDGKGDLLHLEIDDFEIVLPVSQLTSISLFDIAAYNQFQADYRPAPSLRLPKRNQRRGAPPAA